VDPSPRGPLVERRPGNARSARSVWRRRLDVRYQRRVPNENVIFHCWFFDCPQPAILEAIGRYEDLFGVEETVPMFLCEQHAATLRDHVVLLATG
jgi:hypothetical protein